MGIYGNAVIEAVRILANDNNANPREVWRNAVAEFTQNESSINKPCPKNRFLGLLYARRIHGLNFQEHNFNSVEQDYALTACNLLRENPDLMNVPRSEFWGMISDTAYQQQLDVVCSLFNAGLLNV